MSTDLIRFRGAFLLASLLLLLFGARAGGEVVRVEIDRREDVLGGRSWGNAGPYEKLVGRIFFAFDPDNSLNARIVDLGLAPRNAEGRVEAWADFVVLQPKNAAQRRRVAWVEVGERGSKASLRLFSGALTLASDPTGEEDFGDGLLLREGLTLVWVGWQWDVPDLPGLLRLRGPVARAAGEVLHGPVRSDWVVDEEATTLELGHQGHRPYLPLDPEHPENVLTVRSGPEAEREVVPRDQWSFVAADSGPLADQLTGIRLEGGFQAGRIYELVYRAREPRVVGLGLAAVRDVISYAKYELDALFPVRLGVAFGAGQGGRFLRHFLYEGFNVDEKGRKAFDGMFIHGAGAGRGGFNHRFAQPSRGGHPYSSFFFPADLFPFTSRVQKDPVTGAEDGLFARLDPERLPRVFYTNTGYDYWGRAASLIHLSADGTQDVEPRENERIYHLAGAQRVLGSFPPSGDSRLGEEGVPAFRGQALDVRPTLRALALRMVAWVQAGVEPPGNAYPRLADGTLVPPSGMAFPEIPGIVPPASAYRARRLGFGPRWGEGVVDREPPETGPAYPALVPQVDGLGNELGGIRSVELRVPLATYAPWNLRWGYPASTNALVDFLGTFGPLTPADEVRTNLADPRPSVEALYGSKAAFLERVRSATRDLVQAGFLLPEDAPGAVDAADARWDWLMSGEGGGENGGVRRPPPGREPGPRRDPSA